MKLLKHYHLWRANALTRKLRIQEARCDLLAKAERDYQSSYYTDSYRDAMCHRVKIASALEYHKSRVCNSGKFGEHFPVKP